MLLASGLPCFIGVTYVSDRGYLNSILPDGYLVDEKAEPTVIFEVMELRYDSN